MAPDMMSDTGQEETEASHSTAIDDVADTASVEDLASEQDIASEDTALADTATETTEDHAPDPMDQSPLFALPGAGPGLVWMLTRAGVETIEDLAAADPDDLAQRLGLVGEILDLAAWITWAQGQAEA
jgi:predicted flap endonuclease-1-like 5' DNA nuclease